MTAFAIITAIVALAILVWIGPGAVLGYLVGLFGE